MDPDPEGGVGQEGGEWGGGGGNRDMDDKEETNALPLRSIVSFSSEKGTKEPWPPPLLFLYL